MEYTFKTKGVCARSINFEIKDNVVSNVSFMGGCDGNLKAISALVEGATVEEIESKLKGISCGGRPTSCSDQLATGVREALEELKENKSEVV